jgi:DNA-binding winged helix-turn-helix (wHTH) protein
MNTELVPTPLAENQGNSSSGTGVPFRYIRFGMFDLDLQREELFKHGSRVKLQGKVYQALLALLEKPGEVVTREALRLRLWPSDTQVNYDANVNTTVNKLRQVLGDSPEQPMFVDTIPRKGYCFVAKVEYPEKLTLRLSQAQQDGTAASPEGILFETKAFFLGSERARVWFMAGVIALVIAGILFGAAITLYSHRGI